MYKFQSRTFELRKLRPIRQMSAVSLVNLHGRSHTQPCKLRAVLRDIKGQSRVFCVYMRRIVHTTVMLLILHGTLETPLWCRLGSAGFPLWCPVKLPGVIGTPVLSVCGIMPVAATVPTVLFFFS